VLSYWAVSIFFLIFPNILHPRKTYKSKVLQATSDANGKKVMHSAHRGGSRECLENTVEAFQNAVNNGCHMLEFDLQMTKDGVVIVAHDLNLSRLCGVDKTISQLNYNELPKFSEEIHLHFSDGLTFNTKKMNNPYFPPLETVFQKFPDSIMHIDLKNGPTELTIKVHDLIKKYKREHLTFWGNVDKERSEELRKHDPTQLSFFPAKDVMQICAYYILGILPFVKLHHQSYSVPKYTVDFEKMKKRENPGDKFGLFILIVRFLNAISGPLFYHLKKRGIIVTYWVLNHEIDFAHAVEQNVNSIMTDVPTELHSYLKKKDRYLSVKEQ